MASPEMPADSPSNVAALASVSKKQEQLESGRRKLLEYRKKKSKERKNNETNKPSQETLDLLGNDILVNTDTVQDGIALPFGGMKARTLLLSDSRLPKSKNDVELCVGNPEETGKSYFGKSVHADVGEVTDFVDNSSDRDQNAAELIENSKLCEKIYLQKHTPWSKGIQKSESCPSMNHIIKNGQVKDAPKSYLFDGYENVSTRRSGYFSLSHLSEQQNVLKEKTVNSPLAPTFQFTQKSNGKNPQYLSVQQDGSYEFPFESSVTNHQLSIERSPFNPQDLSSSDALLDKERIPVNMPEGSQMSSKTDDFAALEQHIDELTQEKYTLQRSLDVARSLSESLSQQNTAFAEDFNSQAAVINELQEELKKKKEELAAQTLVVSSLMMEREKAQEENNSAVERSQILAGEVISLEEKVLKLRSSELKLQREVEKLKSENESYRGHSANINIDRQHLRSMLEALQEDKKILQRKLQEMLANDDLKYQGRRQRETKEVSTSTDNLGTHHLSSIVESSALKSYVHTSPAMVALPHHGSEFSKFHLWTEFCCKEQSLVDKIDVLITELFMEKTSLLETVREESSKVYDLQVSNVELLNKLELQTQRLELVVAQNMVNIEDVRDFSVAEQTYFVNEGDEVVERVLGWVMHLFPGGSSRRQTSKLL